MVETYLRQSALAHLGLEGRAPADETEAPVRMHERVLPAAVNLRGDSDDPDFLEAVTLAAGLDLPLAPNSVKGDEGRAALWLGPDEWLLLHHDGEPGAENHLAAKLREALAGRHSAVTEVGESLACIRIAGPRAADVIAKGCPLDLHPGVFGGPGRCAQSHLAKTAVTLHQVSEEPAFDVYTRRSFSDYLWHWLSDAAREYAET